VDCTERASHSQRRKKLQLHHGSYHHQFIIIDILLTEEYHTHNPNQALLVARN